MKPTRFTNEAELKALFDYAVRAIGFYEAQRKEALVALDGFATNAPQAGAGQFGEWRISAGFRGLAACAEIALPGKFLSVTIA
jgi:hypothetical protein